MTKAASSNSLWLPPDLRRLLVAKDRRRALWTQAPGLVEREEFMSAALYRKRGGIALRRSGRLAALLVLAVGGAVALLKNPGVDRLLGPLASMAVGAALLVFAGVPGAEVAFPIVVLAGLNGSGRFLLGLAATVAGVPSLFAWPALGLAAPAAAALSRRPLRS